MAQKNTQIEQVELCEGACLAVQFFENRENRVRTLLLKGFIVYLLSMGSIGFYLTAFDISFNVGLCHLLVLLVSLGCAMLYYRLLVENLGYLILFLLFAALVFTFRDYINSGFYAVVNITVDNAAQYFDVDIQRIYSERIGNRYVTVTFVALFIGFVLDILLNVYISRRMQYMTAIVIIMFLNLIPLYLVMEPDMLYVIMMLAGISMAVVFKAGRHYSPQISVKRDDRKYKVQGKKKRELAYVYDVKAMLQAGAHAALFAVLIVTIVSALKPKETFNNGYTGNKYKQLSMSAMTTLLTDGLESFYRPRNYNGGINGGKLGTVSTIYLDNQTDLIVRVTPYTTDRIYLKAFTGIRYNPYANEWTSMSNMNGYEAVTEGQAEAEALKNSYEQENKYSAKAAMHIQCVGVRENLYVPYYMYGDMERGAGAGYDVTYYPRLEGNRASPEYTVMPYQDADLYVPEENIEAVAEVVDALGFIGTQEEIIASLQQYFQDAYPYTVKPGKTPNKSDFVNYFLQENKKGYCAHFASASVLILRYLGIPARYVEGYAIDYEQILEGELVEGAEYADYYDGYSELGETAYVEVNVTDADAHAWVEVYDPVIGWYPVEMTPYAEGEEDVTDFWEEFSNFMNDDGDADEIVENTNAITISDTLVRNILFAAGGLLALAVLAFFVRKAVLRIAFAVRFARANDSDRLIMKYHALLQKNRKKDRAFRECYNYEEQVDYLIAHMQEEERREKMERQKARLVDILRRAGFSGQVISGEEYREALSALLFLVKK